MEYFLDLFFFFCKYIYTFTMKQHINYFEGGKAIDIKTTLMLKG